ncbi:hypothetical protein C2E23DRAFT_813535 [Lenzites betulinus]|nr:hypothetical protein C2E23DRAFT_813535 [Lenzites betulinus]
MLPPCLGQAPYNGGKPAESRYLVRCGTKPIARKSGVRLRARTFEFQSMNHPPQWKVHQPAARAVLKLSSTPSKLVVRGARTSPNCSPHSGGLNRYGRSTLVQLSAAAPTESGCPIFNFHGDGRASWPPGLLERRYRAPTADSGDVKGAHSRNKGDSVRPEPEPQEPNRAREGRDDGCAPTPEPPRQSSAPSPAGPGGMARDDQDQDDQL